MLALCLMLSSTYYAKNYASIIGRGQHIVQCASKNIKGVEVVAMYSDVYPRHYSRFSLNPLGPVCAQIIVTGSAKTLHVCMQILTYFYNFEMA